MRARPFTNFLLINWKVGLEAVVLNEKEVRKLLIPDRSMHISDMNLEHWNTDQ